MQYMSQFSDLCSVEQITYSFFPQDTRIRVMEKESAGQKFRDLSIINSSLEESQTITFTTDTEEELEDWLEALYQHLYDQGEVLCKN